MAGTTEGSGPAKDINKLLKEPQQHYLVSPNMGDGSWEITSGIDLTSTVRARVHTPLPCSTSHVVYLC